MRGLATPIGLTWHCLGPARPFASQRGVRAEPERARKFTLYAIDTQNSTSVRWLKLLVSGLALLFGPARSVVSNGGCLGKVSAILRLMEKFSSTAVRPYRSRQRPFQLCEREVC